MRRTSLPVFVMLLLALSAMTSLAANLVVNGSFEAEGPAGDWPHYGTVKGWYGSIPNTGVNTSSGPFYDNGVHINGSNVAFLQSAASFSQDVAGFVSGQKYTLRFAENQRRDTASPPTLDMTVTVNGVEVVASHTLVPGEFEPISTEFDSPGDGTFTLSFTTVLPNGGDGTLLLDAVSIVPQGEADPFPLLYRPDDIIANGSFEDSEPVAPWPFVGKILWWENSTGNLGVNEISGPYWDNGTQMHGSQVAFLQQGGTFRQTAMGLEAGKNYTLYFLENARSGPSLYVTVSLDGVELLAEHEVVTGEFIERSVDFVSPGAGDFDLEFTSAGPAGQDYTFLLDGVSIVPQGEENPFPPFVRSDYIVANGSFEMSDPVGDWPYYGSPVWWTATTATFGVNNSSGPFWDNGTNVHGTQVAFVQNEAVLTQSVMGLVEGKQYTFYYRENARAATGFLPNLTVTVGGLELVADHQVASGEFVKRSVDFTSLGTGDFDLEFFCTAPEGDSATLLDGISIVDKGQADPYETTAVNDWTLY